MAVVSYLYYEPDKDKPDQLVSAAFNDGYKVYQISADGLYYTSTKGYYRVIGVHYGYFPTTRPYLGGSATPWEYVSP